MAAVKQKKQTKDDQIKALEQQEEDLLEVVKQQNNRINQLQKDAETEFLNSMTYQQMKDEIKVLKSIQAVGEEHNKRQRDTIDELRGEVKALKEQLAQGIDKPEPHNARGAGRKPDLAKRQLFAELYIAGADMNTIMAKMKIGRRTYYRYQAELRRKDDF